MRAYRGNSERLAFFAFVGVLLIFSGFVAWRHMPGDPPMPARVDPAATREPVPSAPSRIEIDVEGAIAKPGVYKLPSGSRVIDAVRAAGGIAPGGDRQSVNLAAPLEDGTQLLVPHMGSGEHPGPYQGGLPSSYSAAPPVSGVQSGRGPKHPTSPVSLNTGSAEQLQTLPGIGPATAQRVVDYRKQHGRFKSVDELGAVGGIGPRKLAALRKWLRL